MHAQRVGHLLVCKLNPAPPLALAVTPLFPSLAPQLPVTCSLLSRMQHTH